MRQVNIENSLSETYFDFNVDLVNILIWNKAIKKKSFRDTPVPLLFFRNFVIISDLTRIQNHVFFVNIRRFYVLRLVHSPFNFFVQIRLVYHVFLYFLNKNKGSNLTLFLKFRSFLKTMLENFKNDCKATLKRSRKRFF